MKLKKEYKHEMKIGKTKDEDGLSFLVLGDDGYKG